MTQAVIDAARQVSDVIERENEALSRLDYGAAVAMVPAKEAAVAALGKALNGCPDPDAVPGLSAVVAGLQDKANANQALLRRAVEVQERVVRIVVRSVSRASSDKVYNGAGVIAAASRPPALAVSCQA